MSDPGLYERIALRRVHDGGVAKVAGVYLDHGRPTPDYLAEVFDRLIWTGWATVADGNPLWQLRRLSLTDTGQARYAALSQQPPAEFTVPAPEFGTTHLQKGGSQTTGTAH
ncbi:MAG: hypothetical protein ACT4NY_33525 [Pseudonocardiales bacterium]